ncbi:MAG TPA: oligosaccharide flippase family protein [Bacteroidales bacterium]|jgi:O-antigen/teichoic acid export membrane protein|nr:oligosaccharide flippase family protein [Bacteroidales bacterium]HKM13017.1 oligosaccharide flippase family protein [Bacteroidales bacterium]HPB88821.1 oligosaccharide flippase family protein [Bacteroidales bacterium]HPY22333.1 oligosaccharide flippase family protein [Bacteroidales bacterium]HQA93053.1 oligosaccharide flippase family protein [Bacteroidales bacterium]
MGVIIRQSFKGTLANYLGVAIGFFTTFFVLVRYLTPEEIGLTRVILDAAVLLAGLSQLGTGSSTMRFFPYFKDEKNKDNGFFFWTLIIPLVGFVIFTLLFFLFKQPVCDFFQEKSPLFVDYYHLVVPIAFWMLYNTVFECNASVLERIAVPRFIKEVGCRIFLLVLYLLYGFKVISFESVLEGFAIIYFLCTLLNIGYLISLKRVSFKPNFKFVTPQIRKDFTLYTLFLVTAAIAGLITPSINTFFVTAKMGLESTGVLTIAIYIVAIIEMPYRSLGVVSLPSISQAMKDGDLQRTNQLCKSVSLHQLLISSFIFMVIWMNIDLFFELLPNGAKYSGAKIVIAILGLSRILHSSLSIATSALGFSKHYYFSLIYTFILTFTAIVLNNKLIPIYGIDGAAWATLISYFVAYIFLLPFLYFTTKVSILSKGQIVVVLIFLIMLITEMFWNRLFEIPSSMGLKITFYLVKTLVICSLGIVAVYLNNVSEDINRIIDKVLRRK